MKKVSTAATKKRTNNFGEQKLTIGLDLGDRSSWYCVLDEAGEILLEQKLGTTPKAVKESHSGISGGTHAVCVRKENPLGPLLFLQF
jgi:hypothetical protein